jgi:hypothetical protein
MGISTMSAACRSWRRELGVPVYGIADLMGWWGSPSRGLDAVGFNKGGTVGIGDVAVTMVARDPFLFDHAG